MKRAFLTILIVFSLNSITIADVLWEDNAIHTLDSSNHINDRLILDYSTVNDPGTTVNMVAGGYVSEHLIACNNAKINMSGGVVGVNVIGHRNSRITITGGIVSNNLQATEQAHISMSGGEVWDGAELFDNSTFDMTGGYIREIIPSGNVAFTMSGGSTLHIQTNYSAIVYLDGTDFVVTDLNNNSTALSAGDKLSDYSTFIENGTNDFLQGNISGILSDGTVLDIPYQIFNMGDSEGIADIVIIPEPATLVVMSVGGLFLRRNRKA